MTNYPVTFKQRGWPISAAVVVVLVLIAVWFIYPNFFFVAILAIAAPCSVVVILRFAIMDTYV